jgi:hypothetical protein
MKGISSGDAATDKALDEIRGAIPDLEALDGLRLLENVQLTSGVTARVPHGLGRKPRGWLVVRTDSGAALGYIYDEQRTQAKTDVYLYLRAEGYSPLVSLLVF